MTTTTTTTTRTVESKLLAKWAPGLLSAAILILGGLQALTASTLTAAAEWTFVALVASTVANIILPMLPQVAWAGILKTGVEILSVIAAVAIPWFTQNGHLTRANAILFVVAVLKALATEFGVQIRSDAATTIDAGSTSDAGIPSITTVTVPDATAPVAADPTSTAKHAADATDATASDPSVDAAVASVLTPAPTTTDTASTADVATPSTTPDTSVAEPVELAANVDPVSGLAVDGDGALVAPAMPEASA